MIADDQRTPARTPDSAGATGEPFDTIVDATRDADGEFDAPAADASSSTGATADAGADAGPGSSRNHAIAQATGSPECVAAVPFAGR
jgi:hypothetical protein